MKNCTITVASSHFASAINFTARHDVRYYLNGALLEATETETRVVATDGHIAAVHRACQVNGLGGEKAVAVIIPNDTLASLVKFAGRKGCLVNVCRTDDRWEIVGPDFRLGFVPVDGKFPDYRMIIPTTTSGEPGQFNPELMVKFSKAAKALGAKGFPVIDHNGTSGARVTLTNVNGFVGVVMPFRVKPEDRVDTSWARAA